MGALLGETCRRACAGEEIGDAILAWLKTVLPLPVPKARPRRRRQLSPKPVEHQVSAKKKRRMDYAIVQRLFRTNQKAAADVVLGGLNPQDRQGILGNKEDFAEYWRNVFETPSKRLDAGPRGPARPKLAEDVVWGPVTSDEVVKAKVKTGTAAGPDGVSPAVWNKVPASVKAILFNIFLLTGAIPAELRKSRTVFLPKKANSELPGDYRPISITSVVVRHFHKILAARLQRLNLVDQRQRGFRLGVDGVAENLCVLQTALADARIRTRTLHLACLDVSKAFDTVSHQAIVEACCRVGLPDVFVDYVSSLYTDGSTVLEICGEKRTVAIGRGVKQGDPLSPLLFNLVLDGALESLDREVGYSVEGHVVGALAFADDMVLLSTTRLGMQKNIDSLSTSLSAYGLMLNPSKSHAVSLVADGKRKRVKVLEEPIFTIGTERLPQYSTGHMWVYLGARFEGAVTPSSAVALKTMLDRLTRAPLRPQQRMHLLRDFALPRVQHLLVGGRVTVGYLRGLDRHLRAAVRSWLHLPRDTPIGYFHAPIVAGGLGVPMLSQFVPRLRLERIERLLQSPADNVRACASSHTFRKQLEWCRMVLRGLDNFGAGGEMSREWGACCISPWMGGACRRLKTRGQVLSGKVRLRSGTEHVPEATMFMPMPFGSTRCRLGCAPPGEIGGIR